MIKIFFCKDYLLRILRVGSWKEIEREVNAVIGFLC
jgi:hypothetical protein